MRKSQNYFPCWCDLVSDNRQREGRRFILGPDLRVRLTAPWPDGRRSSCMRICLLAHISLDQRAESRQKVEPGYEPKGSTPVTHFPSWALAFKGYIISQNSTNSWGPSVITQESGDQDPVSGDGQVLREGLTKQIDLNNSYMELATVLSVHQRIWQQLVSPKSFLAMRTLRAHPRLTVT